MGAIVRPGFELTHTRVLTRESESFWLLLSGCDGNHRGCDRDPKATVSKHDFGSQVGGVAQSLRNWGKKRETPAISHWASERLRVHTEIFAKNSKAPRKEPSSLQYSLALGFRSPLATGTCGVRVASGRSTTVATLLELSARSHNPAVTGPNSLPSPGATAKNSRTL